MNNLLLIFRNFCVVFALLMFFSCGEIIPGISITSPQNEQEYFKDEDIDIKTIITDTKGKSFDVQLYVDDEFMDEVSSAPYYFTIKAGKVLPGKHTLKITTAGVEAFRTIIVKEANSESDDFVTFEGGIIPLEWSVKDWYINTGGGYDDNYSLFTMTSGATVSTTKTCNKISFYMKGYGTISFYLDNHDKPFETIILGEGDPHNPEPQDWKLYEFDCPKRFHTFAWVFDFGSTARLDAIRFEN